MANGYEFLIVANDEHGLNPPTPGKRTPVLPYLNRQFYENEFNREAKYYFILACLRCGFRVYDAHPESSDTAVSRRVARINARSPSLVVTFAYNAYGDGVTFNNANGYIVFYERASYRPTQSRLLAYDISTGLSQTLETKNLGVGTLTDVGILSSVRCPSVLVEAGFMTNLTEAKLMYDDDWCEAVGEGATRGVCAYTGVDFVNPYKYYPTLRRGNRGNEVAILQYALRHAGYEITPDGVFGSQTEQTVRRFQGLNGLAVDGVVGRNTWNALTNDYTVFPTIREGRRGEIVKYAQRKLTSKLYDTGEVDGIFGAKTTRAVKEFQSENGLEPDGIIGRKTWAKLRPTGENTR